uniref:Mitochondrial import inner membrane translocase subunit n=1 Tax=Strombidinopsis acuminata TaxID=141414 RepID=A0A7S3TKN1_9SPIT
MDDADISQAKMQVQGQMAAQYIQEVMQVITTKCFAKCVTRPGPKLDDSEKICTAKCMDRYLDAMAIVSQTWAARAKAQAQMGGNDSGFM